LEKEKRFEIIDELGMKYSITHLCSIAQVSRAGYYKWKKNDEKRAERRSLDANTMEHILAIHRLHPYYGYFRMQTALRREGIVVNHKRVRRLMRILGIRSIIRKKRSFAGRKPSVVFPNVLQREFRAAAPKQKLVTDITYVRIGDHFAYLSVIMDLFNNEILSWKLSSRNDFQLVVDTVKGIQAEGALLHSDQGFQYTSKSYATLLKTKELVGSHSRRENCYDNACMESFFSHLKAEKLYLEKPKDEVSAHTMITEFIAYYNAERFQKRLGDRSPIEFREAIAA
jgi:putative transposase